ncbi:substrate-binding domain-containing protein [Thermodesulfatator atlanticus]
MTKDNLKTYLTTKEVAALLDVNEKIVYQLINEKGLPATKVTGKWLFPRHLVEKWLEKHVVNHPGKALDFEAELVIVIGSNDLLLERTLSLYNKRHAKSVAVFGSVGSLRGIWALKDGLCHIATAHLLESDEKNYNFAYLREHFGEFLPVVVNFCFREQGLLVAPGNPKNIKSLKDLTRDDITYANRPKGTGTRVLLEHELKKLGVSFQKIRGFENEFNTHLEVGLEVLSGRADTGLAIRAIAKLLGLDFIPIKRERYDLLIPKDTFFQKNIQKLLGLLQEEDFKRLAVELTGYDVSQAGRIVFPQDD